MTDELADVGVHPAGVYIRIKKGELVPNGRVEHQRRLAFSTFYNVIPCNGNTKENKEGYVWYFTAIGGNDNRSKWVVVSAGLQGGWRRPPRLGASSR